MKSISNKIVGLFALCLALAGTSRLARADLLDEAPEPSVVAPPSPQSTPTSKPKDASKTQKGIKSLPDNDSAKSPPTPGQTVLAPKNPGKKPASNKDKEPVHFESKGLKGLREQGMVELVDDVVVTQANFRLEADHAQVFFDEVAHDVLKVIADGNVKIFNVDENTGEKLKAFGNQVVFLNKERLVILEGNARLWRGEDSMIRGKKITYEMDTGWIKADRVAGELTPSDKDNKK